jgi:hypothetical protein
MKRFALAALAGTEPKPGGVTIDEPTGFNSPPDPFAGWIMSRQLRDQLLTIRDEKGELFFRPTVFGIPARPGVTASAATKFENEIKGDLLGRFGK